MDPRPQELDLELLLRHRTWLRALAARLVGPGLADDLLQETWLAALRRPPDPERPARPWLASVARRLASRVRSSAPEGKEPEGESPSTDELLEQVELEGRLAREVARLAEPLRRTVLLRYHEGLSAAEIARREGIPAGTVRWRLKRGLDELRGRLDKDYGGRKSWVALLAGLAGVEAGGAWLGLSTTVKLAGAAGIAALLAAGGAAWIARPAPPAHAARDARAPAELAAAQAHARPADAGPSAARVSEERRAASSTLPAAAPEGPLGLTFKVVDWDGAPGADLPVALRPHTAPVPAEPTLVRTDATGRVAFPEAQGEVDVAVERRSAQPFVTSLAADGVEHTLKLPRGAVVSGRILVGGVPPERPIQLALYPTDQPDASVPKDAQAGPALLFEGGGTLRAATGAGGTFTFMGLSRDWRGILQLQDGCVPRGRLPNEGYSEKPYVVFLPEPQEGIALDVDRRPSVRGRVVDAMGEASVPRAELMLNLTWPDGFGMAMGATTDAEGRFEAILGEHDFRSVFIEYAAPGNIGRATRFVERAEASADGDVGDLRLAPGRQATLLVVDEAGLPIAGASIESRGPTSDSQGRLAFACPLEETSIWVSARGYVGRSITVPLGADVIEVVLEPANALVLEAVDRDGWPLPQVEIQVSAENPLFFTRHAMPERLTKDEGDGEHVFTVYDKNSFEGFRKHTFRTNAQGRLTLSGMRPGMALDLNVRSGCHDSLTTGRAESPAAGERRRVVLRVAEELLSLRARIVDQERRPVSGARLALSLSPGKPYGVNTNGLTDGEGWTKIPVLTRNAYYLQIEQQGYLPLLIDPFYVPDGELELVLERGLDVVVRVRDTAGNPVAGGQLECPALGKEQTFREVEVGRFDLLGLPDQRLELSLDLSGVTYTLQQDPRAGQADFVVPVHGAVAVSWSGPTRTDWGEHLRIVLYPEDGSRKHLEKAFVHTPTGQWLFPAVAPGVYEVVLDRDIEQEDVPPVELTQRAHLEVHGGETLRIALVPLP